MALGRAGGQLHARALERSKAKRLISFVVKSKSHFSIFLILTNSASCSGVNTHRYLAICFDTVLPGLILSRLHSAPVLYVGPQVALMLFSAPCTN